MYILIYNPLFFIPFIAGLIFMLAGIILMKYPPKEINSLYGYRTKNSMKNIKRWQFAQKYASKKMILWGFFLSSSCLLGFIFNFKTIYSVFISSIFIVLFAIILVIKIEKALIIKFD